MFTSQDSVGQNLQIIEDQCTVFPKNVGGKASHAKPLWKPNMGHPEPEKKDCRAEVRRRAARSLPGPSHQNHEYKDMASAWAIEGCLYLLGLLFSNCNPWEQK